MPVCPRCDQDNPDIARFCLACGAALAEPARTGEERQEGVLAVRNELRERHEERPQFLLIRLLDVEATSLRAIPVQREADVPPLRKNRLAAASCASAVKRRRSSTSDRPEPRPRLDMLPPYYPRTHTLSAAAPYKEKAPLFGAFYRGARI